MAQNLRVSISNHCLPENYDFHFLLVFIVTVCQSCTISKIMFRNKSSLEPE